MTVPLTSMRNWRYRVRTLLISFSCSLCFPSKGKVFSGLLKTNPLPLLLNSSPHLPRSSRSRPCSISCPPLSSGSLLDSAQLTSQCCWTIVRVCHIHIESLFKEIDLETLPQVSWIRRWCPIFKASIPGLQNTVKNSAFIIVAPKPFFTQKPEIPLRNANLITSFPVKSPLRVF